MRERHRISYFRKLSLCHIIAPSEHISYEAGKQNYRKTSVQIAASHELRPRLHRRSRQKFGEVTSVTLLTWVMAHRAFLLHKRVVIICCVSFSAPLFPCLHGYLYSFSFTQARRLAWSIPPLCRPLFLFWFSIVSYRFILGLYATSSVHFTFRQGEKRWRTKYVNYVRWKTPEWRLLSTHCYACVFCIPITTIEHTVNVWSMTYTWKCANILREIPAILAGVFMLYVHLINV